MTYTPNTVVSYGFPMGQFTFTYLMANVALTDTATAATVGKAVSLDASAANTVTPAADGDPIFGRVYSCEARTGGGGDIVTAAVARKFKEKLPAASGHGILVGGRVVGAGGGLVKAATANAGDGELTDPIVVETGDDYVVAEML